MPTIMHKSIFYSSYSSISVKQLKSSLSWF